ncbi:MAG: AI-2E family transporter [Rhizobiales bacterium]|nr:AI-2E family transporter [Hyphomicrobiales bacterium]
MTLRAQLRFWVIALAILIGGLWLFSEILLPFLAGLVLAYFLDPVADALERLGLPRLVATLIIVLVSVVALVVALIVFLPILGEQIAKLAAALPHYVSGLVARFNQLAPEWLKNIFTEPGPEMSGQVGDFAGKLAGWLATLIASVWSGGLALVNLVSLLLVTPVVAFYLLNDWDHMIARVDSWLPRAHAPTIRKLAREINQAMAGFIRGQGTVCLLLGAFYAIALSLAGLSFGMLIGLVTGILSFIPFVGAIFGGVAAIGMAVVQFWPDWIQIGIIAGIFVLGQFIEGNFLSPKLVGDSVGLHPVWLMFALFAFGYLFGFVGLLMAVPLAAAAGVLFRFALAQYLASPLYLAGGESITEIHPPSKSRAAKRK